MMIGSRKEFKREIERILNSKPLTYSDPAFPLILEWLNSYKPVDRTRRFFIDVERKLDQDHEFFWKLLRHIVVTANASKQFLEKFDEAINRYDRLEVSQRERIRISSNNLMDPPSGKTAEDETLIFFDALPDEITAYRGFILSGDERARAGDKSTEEYFQQETGKGFSFTLNKDRAVFFAGNSAHHYTDGLQPLKSTKTKTRDETQKKFQFFYRGGTPYIGEYIIPKDKVLLVIPEFGEEEIWVHPNDAHFKRYSTANAEEVFNKYVMKCPSGYFQIAPGTTYEDMQGFDGNWRKRRPPNKE
jgi:hypothetical protein